MADKKPNKIIYGGQVLIDLTSDTVTEDKLLQGYTAHDKSGEIITGTCTFDSDTSEGTATSDEILNGEIAYSNGNKIVGTMPNNGQAVLSILDLKNNVVIPLGYHDGSGYAKIDDSEASKIIPSNIRQGVSILGVVGSMSGTESVKAQTKTLTPATTAKTYTPDSGYNYFSEVTVDAIPYNESSNAAGGTTITIG